VDTSSLHNIETWLFLEAVYRQWGYDYRGYSSALLARRLQHRMLEEKCATISELQSKILRHRSCLDRFLDDMSVEVTEWFRDAEFFTALTRIVFPRLDTYPYLRVWVAGCASGEEVYSLAILLDQAGLLAKTRMYATDISLPSLATARAARYPSEDIHRHRASFIAAGGKGSFDDYIDTYDEFFMPNNKLRKGMVFARHNLAMDHAFNQFQLVLCRNVLIYFGHELQRQVHRTLHCSIEPLGVLGLGSQEHLRFSPHLTEYERLAEETPLYRRVSQEIPPLTHTIP
jgi:chemotaxis protein methyltransferase CheR